MRERFLREEGGFTLPELLVTMVMMLTVMFALYSIFDMSIRVFSFGNDKVEAVENARVSMERMEREIRAAYPTDKVGGDTTLIRSYGPNPTNSITFGNNLNNNYVVDDPGEVISYSVDGGNRLLRNTEALAALGPTGSLQFRYLKNDGTDATSEGEVRIVQISLKVDVDDRTQILTTDVALRNRGS